jgi:hypothetical protein
MTPAAFKKQFCKWLQSPDGIAAVRQKAAEHKTSFKVDELGICGELIWKFGEYNWRTLRGIPIHHMMSHEEQRVVGAKLIKRIDELKV